MLYECEAEEASTGSSGKPQWSTGEGLEVHRGMRVVRLGGYQIMESRTPQDADGILIHKVLAGHDLQEGRLALGVGGGD